MNLPVSDAGSRCLFKDEATHMPVGASWCRTSQESALLRLAPVPEESNTEIEDLQRAIVELASRAIQLAQPNASAEFTQMLGA